MSDAIRTAEHSLSQAVYNLSKAQENVGEAQRVRDELAAQERRCRENLSKLKMENAPPVDRTQRTLTDGSPITEDHRELKPNGQQKAYVVLSEEERAKGFKRPVRRSYVHVGIPPPTFPLQDLAEDQKRFADEYVKFEPYPEGYRGNATGRYWTQAQIDKINIGCGGTTRMGDALAETYARDPSFYSGTFCCDCGTHFPVGERGEFVWADAPTERVGT